MSGHGRPLLAAAVVVVALAAATAAASANKLSLNAATFRATWSQWTITGSEGFFTFRCPLTLSGSFHSQTILKTAGLLVGYVTTPQVNASACSGGTPTLLTEQLPWHVRYRGFAGVLPAFSSVWLDLIGVAYSWATPFGTCSYGATAASPAGWTAPVESGGAITGLRWDEARRVPKISGGFCPAYVTYSGSSGAVTQSNSATALIARLARLP